MELGLEAIGERLQGDAFRPLSADELSGLVRWECLSPDFRIQISNGVIVAIPK